MLGEVGERDVGRALADHEVDGDQALEDGRPCRVVEAVLQGAEDLADAGFVGMCCDENVLNVFCLWRRKLEAETEVSRERREEEERERKGTGNVP